MTEVIKKMYGISVHGENNYLLGPQQFRFVFRQDGKHTLECFQKGKNFTLRLNNEDIKIIKEAIDMYEGVYVNES